MDARRGRNRQVATSREWERKFLLNLGTSTKRVNYDDAQTEFEAVIGPAVTATTSGVVPLLERLRPRLVAALSLHCGNLAVAEELAQEACLRLWLHWDKARTKQSPEAWAFRVAFNLANSWWRRRTAELRARRRLESMPPPPGASAADASEAFAIRSALQHISGRRRTALILRYYLDLSLVDTARVMQCAPGTVKALCSQGAAQLRELLDYDEEDDLR